MCLLLRSMHFYLENKINNWKPDFTVVYLKQKGYDNHKQKTTNGSRTGTRCLF
jgi:hypothetical protein